MGTYTSKSEPKDYLHPNPFPGAAVRDLLAICRALYLTRKNEGAGPDELETIARAGKAFATALSMGQCKPETIGARAAWSWSEKGLALLGEALSNGDVSVQTPRAAGGAVGAVAGEVRPPCG